MKIALGTDHRGFEHKEHIKKHSQLVGVELKWVDCGAHNAERSDYPQFAVQVCKAVQEQKADRGILLCGSGIGMAIVANRYAHIYAALVWNETVARMSGEDDNANILVLPADFLTDQEAVAIITAWLVATFKGGRYLERIKQIDALGGL